MDLRDCGRCGSVACALTVVVLLLSCADERATRSVSRSELRIPIDREVQTLDPRTRGSLDIVTHNVLRQLYEGLVDYDPRTLEPVPRVAAAWEVSDDGTLWTFRLSPGVRFSDDPCFADGRGREATAADAKFSIETGLTGLRNLPPDELPPIVGLGAYLSGTAAEIAGIGAATPTELTIRLTRPDPSLLHVLARPACYLVPREALRAYGDDLRVHPVGTGPFRLVSWDPAASLLLVRRDDYWRRDAAGERLPYVDVLRFLVTTDSVRLYAQERVDMFTAYHPPEMQPYDLPGSGGEQEFSVNWLNVIYVRFHYASDHPVVRDPRLRRAVSLAVSRRSKQVHVAARGLFPPGLPGHDPALEGQRHDDALARDLLRQAGYPGGRGLPQLTIAFPHFDDVTGRFVVTSLQELGLDVRLVLRDRHELAGLVREGEADLFRDGWVADYPDPENFLQLFASRSRSNRGGYANPEFDRLFRALRTELDREARFALARRLERILLDDTAAVFLRHEAELQYVSPAVDGWEHNCANPLNIRLYERVRRRG